MRVQKGLKGQIKRPLPRQKALDAARPRVPVTLLANKKAVRKTQKRRGPTLRPNRASPGPHSGEVAGEITRAGLREITGRAI